MKFRYLILGLLLVLLGGGEARAEKFYAVSTRHGASAAKQNAEIKILQSENQQRLNENTAQDASITTLLNSLTATISQVNSNTVNVVPSGAVMAFDLNSCPSGWSALSAASGRFIVGTGALGSDNYGLGAVGGEARHTLTIAEMPSHDHDIGIPGWTNSFVEYDYVQGGGGPTAGVNGDGLGPFLRILPTGGSQPHKNRPPYLALLYCQKD